MRFHSILIVFLFVSATAFADTSSRGDTNRLNRLFAIVGEREPSPFPGEERWPHRAVLMDAAGLQKGSSDSAVSRAMKIAWQQFAGVRISRPDEPKVFFHELLKLALEKRYGPLLLDAARWRVDLNRIDWTERATLLDMLEREYRNNKGDADAEWLREYKKVLQAAGAEYFVSLDFRMRRLARKYTRVRPPVFGFYAVERNGKWGWVDEHNNILVPLRYKAVRYTDGKNFEVSADGSRFSWVTKSK